MICVFQTMGAVCGRSCPVPWLHPVVHLILTQVYNIHSQHRYFKTNVYGKKPLLNSSMLPQLQIVPSSPIVPVVLRDNNVVW